MKITLLGRKFPSGLVLCRDTDRVAISPTEAQSWKAIALLATCVGRRFIDRHKPRAVIFVVESPSCTADAMIPPWIKPGWNHVLSVCIREIRGSLSALCSSRRKSRLPGRNHCSDGIDYALASFPRPMTSVMSIIPTGRPSSSMTGNSLTCLALKSCKASSKIALTPTVKGRFVMTSEIERSN